MTDINTTLQFVSLDATHDDLNRVIAAIKYRREELARKAKHALDVGQKVKFSSRNTTYQGVIKSIKLKKAIVDCGISKFDVPLSMLEAA